MTDPWEQHRAAQVEEYGQWVAAGPIYVGMALAYNEGDPVPASNVKLHGYDKSGQVVRVSAATKPATK